MEKQQFLLFTLLVVYTSHFEEFKKRRKIKKSPIDTLVKTW